MTIEWVHVLAFNAALFVAILSPGPALIVTLRTAIVEGRVAGVLTTVGLGGVACLWTLAALLGLDALFSAAPWAAGAIRLIGACYLIWIAFTTWRGATTPLGEAPQIRPGAALLRGALVNLTNPKSILFAAAVLVVIFPPHLSSAEIAFIVLNHWLLEIVVYSAIVLAVTLPPIRARYLALKPTFDRIAAGVLGALGLRLLLDRGTS